jgi:hypothetical protein
MSWVLIGKIPTGTNRRELGNHYTETELAAAKRSIRNGYEKTWGKKAGKNIRFKYEVKWH